MGRAKSTATVWDTWQGFGAELGVDSLLEAIQDKVPVLSFFAQRVRPGELAARSYPILARSAEDYLRDFAQTSPSVGPNDRRIRVRQSETVFRLMSDRDIARRAGAWLAWRAQVRRAGAPSARRPSKSSGGSTVCSPPNDSTRRAGAVLAALRSQACWSTICSPPND